MNTYNDYIEDVSRGTHCEQHTVNVYMQHDWSGRINIVKENINISIPQNATVEVTYFPFDDETWICFKWFSKEEGIE